MRILDKLLLTGAAISPLVTEMTKNIGVKATSISQIMDTANGGVIVHGGMHRVVGGHSVADIGNWIKFGPNYISELSKDFITPHGLPLPGVETLARNNLISKSFATKYGSINIGQSIGLGFSVLQSYRMRMDIKSNKLDPMGSKPLVVGGLKISIGIATNNPFVAINGAVDIALNINDRLTINTLRNYRPPYVFGYGELA